MLFEKILKIVFCGLKREITYVQFHLVKVEQTCELQRRSREPGFRITKETNSTDDLPSNEPKQNLIQRANFSLVSEQKQTLSCDSVSDSGSIVLSSAYELGHKAGSPGKWQAPESPGKRARLPRQAGAGVTRKLVVINSAIVGAKRSIGANPQAWIRMWSGLTGPNVARRGLRLTVAI